MKWITLFVCLFCAPFIHAQDLTGIWRGQFISGNGFTQQRYNYEVQILEVKSKNGKALQSSLKGVTYSYLTKEFYGKAALHGIYSASLNNITFTEDTLIDVHSSSGFTCLMTCYMQYSKQNNTEILKGTFSSIGTDKSSDCGGGSVYLERVKESEFKKEDFLIKKTTAPKTTKPLSQTLAAQNQKAAPVVKRPLPSGKNFDTTQTVTIPKTIAVPATQPILKPLPPTPLVIKQRDNELVQTITTNSPQIKIELYDNGIIDGDTITVYHNNELVVDAKELTEKPITVSITADSVNTHHEFVMVANNLGRIPPNTALMVVTTGGKRYEVNISSDEKKNAKLIVEYKPE